MNWFFAESLPLLLAPRYQGGESDETLEIGCRSSALLWRELGPKSLSSRAVTTGTKRWAERFRLDRCRRVVFRSCSARSGGGQRPLKQWWIFPDVMQPDDFRHSTSTEKIPML